MSGPIAMEQAATRHPPPPALSVAPHNGSDADWDVFVRRAPGGTIFHLSGWRDVLVRTFGFRPHCLVAKRGDAIAGVLPLFELRRLLGRGCLLSVPFAVEGGVCGIDAEARQALADEALRLAHECGAGWVELRDRVEGEGGGYRVREGTYFSFRRALAASEEENLAAIPRKQRRMVRVGQQSGLQARVDAADLDVFYDLYARSVRQLGTPVFPRRYFQSFLEAFPNDCTLLTVRHEGTPVASVMSFFFNDTVLPYYAGSRREYFRHAVNDFMYWELMRHAAARGARVFDFGRSKKGSGAFDFKCHWGFEPEPLRYRVAGATQEAATERTAASSRLSLLQDVWRRLPLAVTKVLGPYFLRRWGAFYT